MKKITPLLTIILVLSLFLSHTSCELGEEITRNEELPVNLEVIPRGKELDLTDKISSTSSDISNGGTRRSFNRFSKDDTHYELGSNGKWGNGEQVPARGSFRQYHSVWVEEDGSLTIAWMNVAGSPTKNVKDKDGNPVTFDNEIFMGQNIMLSKASSNGQITSTKTLVKHVDNHEITGSFAGITKMSDGKYITAYRRYDDPEKRITKNETYIYEPYIANNFKEDNTNFDKVIGQIYGGFLLRDKRVEITTIDGKPGWQVINTENYARLNVTVFDENANNLSTSTFYPTEEDLTNKDLSRPVDYFTTSGNFYDFGYAGRSQIRHLENTVGIYSTIGIWGGDNIQHQTDIFVTFNYSDGKVKLKKKVPYANSHILYPRFRKDSYSNRFVGSSVPDVKTLAPIRVFNVDPQTGERLELKTLNIDPDKVHGNHVYTIIGDIAVFQDRYIVSFTTANSRNSRDVGIAILDKDLNTKKIGFITASKGSLTSNENWYLLSMCRAFDDDKALLAWEEITPGTTINKPGKTYFAILDKEGNMLQGPAMADESVALPLGDNFFTYKNGDIGWTVGKGNTIEIFRYKIN